jgi:PPM family protein phosphatase
VNRLRRIGKQPTPVEEPQAAAPAETEEAAPQAEATTPAVDAPETEAPVAEAESSAAPMNGYHEAVPEAADDAAQAAEESTEAPPEETAVAASVAEDAPVVTEPEVVEQAPAEVEIAPGEGDDAPAPLEVQASEDDQAVAGAELPAEEATEAAEAAEEEEGEEIKTAPLSPAENEELTPLPGNAVVGGKYVVQSQLHHGADRNLYRVAARKQQKCPACGRLSSADATTCEYCRSELTSQPPAEFYLMAESFHPQALMQDPAVMDLQLYHPNIVPVVDYFSYTPFGRGRYYAVAEPRQGVRLSQLSMPRPGTQVFEWALQLADALDYLHSKGVIGAGAEADDILVQGDMASLASLQNARVAEHESPERTQLQSMDLAKLAATIYEAYVGHPATMTPEGVLPMPSQAPEKVGLALRAAIEPVQGIAAAISAAEWRDLLSQALLAISDLEQPGMPVTYTSASLSDVGRVREQNQDSFSTTEFLQSSVERPMNLGLYVVADGMGGHKGGEIASAIASQVFSSEVIGRVLAPLTGTPGNGPNLANETILQGMARAVQTANERIYKARDSRQNDMGTTLVAVLIANGKAYVVNVGDSRFYFYTQRPEEDDAHPIIDTTAPLKSKGATVPLKRTAQLEEPGSQVQVQDQEKTLSREDYMLTQVSVDHSLVHRLVELGQLDPEEAKVHPHRNFIYRSLGGPPPIEVDTFVRTLRPGDRLLLCSDGLNSMIEDEQIEEVLATAPDSQDACRQLVELANEAGGHDNITTIIVDVLDYIPLTEHQH